ncbi:MAG TPA: DUF2027 domain-containing protein [Bacteroidales bacterium]|nr:DUF2027 domain-containing protein [Bacteroidales bacterium]
MNNSKFYIGDQIRFLNETGGGVVIDILKKDLYLIRSDDGFEYPVPEKELVLIKRKESVSTKFEPKELFQQPKDEKLEAEGIKASIELKEDDSANISLAWIPSEGQEFFDGKLDLFLVNDSNYFILYHILKHDDYGLSMLDAGNLEPNLKIEISHFTREDLNSLKSIQVQIILYGHKKNIFCPLIDKKFSLKPVKFFNQGNYTENDFFDVAAYFLTIMDGHKYTQFDNDVNIEEVIAEKEKDEEIDKSSKYKARPKPETIEVDLHINVLKENIVGMTNSEILEFQMLHFHNKLTEAIQNKISKIIFIHGIGNGTLRDTLRESLDKQYKLKYQDASFREYGFGATLVYVR